MATDHHIHARDVQVGDERVVFPKNGERIASYNWSSASRSGQPRMIVPGSPLNYIPSARRVFELSRDGGDFWFDDANAVNMGPSFSPMEPIFHSLSICAPDVDVRAFDVIADTVVMMRLLRFCRSPGDRDIKYHGLNNQPFKFFIHTKGPDREGKPPTMVFSPARAEEEGEREFDLDGMALLVRSGVGARDTGVARTPSPSSRRRANNMGAVKNHVRGLLLEAAGQAQRGTHIQSQGEAPRVSLAEKAPLPPPSSGSSVLPDVGLPSTNPGRKSSASDGFQTGSGLESMISGELLSEDARIVELKVSNRSNLDTIPEGQGQERTTVWRKEGYHEDYTKSPILPDDREDITEYVELLAMLHSPPGQNFLGKFSMEIGTQHVLFAWSDIQEYRAIPTIDYRYTKAKQIFGKYLRSMPTALDFVPETLASEIYSCIEQAREDKGLLGPELFFEVQKMCFRQIFKHTFQELKKDHESRYTAHIEEGAERYNKIDVDDFWYMEKLGEGAFGKVVHVVKKSTGRHYAMKIQHKTELLRSFSRSLSRLDNEKMVFQACNHPFVLQMDYAFQTELHAIIVLNLVTTGNLQDAIDSSPKRRLEELRARFYAAEISLALMHLHDMGLIDLKPRNVMLGMDGHIQLADMGGIRKHGTQAVRRGTLMNFKRRSIMGTKGYMAPEMAKLLNQSNDQRQGYNEAVDWWSLGVTVYKMLTGMRPFDPPPWARKKSVVALLRRQTEYEKLQAGVEYPRYMSEASVSFVSALLRHEVENRLGSGPTGKQDIKSHAFMAGILWDRLAAKNVEPPFVPTRGPLCEEPLYDTFDEMMEGLQEQDARFNRKKRSAEKISPEEQKYFSTWRYISPQTLRIEMGLSQAMEDIETNFKVMQLTGESSMSTTGQPARMSHVLKQTGKAVINMGRALTTLKSNVSNASNVSSPPSMASPRDDASSAGGPGGPPSPLARLPSMKSFGSLTGMTAL
eukprot:g5895.t1